MTSRIDPPPKRDETGRAPTGPDPTSSTCPRDAASRRLADRDGAHRPPADDELERRRFSLEQAMLRTMKATIQS